MCYSNLNITTYFINKWYYNYSKLLLLFLKNFIGLDESSVSKYISELIQKEVIHGTCTAKEFVPSIFKLHQRVEVDEYFKLYGLIELNKLTSTYKVWKFSLTLFSLYFHFDFNFSINLII